MNDIFVLPLQNSDTLCLIDSDKAECVMKYKWKEDKKGYIRTMINLVSIKLHRFVSSIRYNIDHANRNKADNRLYNLRGCSNQGNNYNSDKRKIATSKYKGVTYRKDNGKWRTRVVFNYKIISGGEFETEKEAAIKANKLYKQYAGEFAVLNIIE